MEEGIEERKALSPESLAADIGMSYISALTPKLGVDPKTNKMRVEGGELGTKITEDIGKWKEGRAAKSLIKARGSVPLDLEETFDMPFGDQFGATPQEELLDLWSPSEEWASPQSAWDIYYGEGASPTEEGLSEEPFGIGFQQGGQVSKYYGGGSVSGGSPTIAGYFNQQGKTMGGSNTQSLTEMLGRK